MDRKDVGIFTVAFNDLTIPVSGIPITVTRTYDSRVKVKKDFGVGWELGVTSGRFTTNRKLGDGWSITKKIGFFQPPCGQVNEPKRHKVEVRLSDREVFRFVPRLVETSGGLGFCEGRMVFQEAGSVRPGATLELLGQPWVQQLTGESLLRDPDTLAVINPEDVRLTTPEGVKIDLNRIKGIKRIEDLNGNAVSITPAGLVHNAGLSVSFQRDAQGRISRITDPMGRTLQYGYDGNGDLVSFKDQLANETRFTYLASPAHHLQDIINALGQRGIRNEYDQSGRLVATIDARGQRIEMEHDIPGRHEVVRNRLGHPTEFFYDERGNVTLERKFVTVNAALVPVETTRTYDADDNELTVTDPMGRVTAKTYDARSNVLSTTLASGTPDEQTTTYSYNTRNQLLTTTDALGAVRSTTYDSKGNAVYETDALGRTSTSTYDLRGNLVRVGDPLGYETRYGYDSKGRMTSQTNAVGVTTTYTYDLMGNQLSEVLYRTDEFGQSVKVERKQEYDALNRVVRDIDALGNAAVTEYDALSRVVARVDRRGFRSTTQYDELGQVVRTNSADGYSELSGYDAEGRRTESTDKARRVTRYAYDELGRGVQTTNTDGTLTRVEYDLGGSVVADVDERGNRTEYEYDAQGRQVLERNAVGDVTRVDFDAVGNRASAMDGRGNVTRFEYDANRRQTATMFADGYRTRSVYDVAGRVVARIDQRNVVTRYEYDGLGKLVAVVDALGGRTSHAYDQPGNRVSQTDANGHITRFGFDSEGRMVSRTLPLGQRESLEYDAAGNQTAKVTFNGDRLEYDFDSNGRMIGKRVPGYSQYVLTYTPTGQRESVLDYQGLTSYWYDARDRLVRVDNPEGTFVSYTYDLAGNRASVTSPSQTVEYTFDAANRMTTVTSPAGVATYSYDAASNQIGLTHANGVHEARTYDPLNRLLTIDSRTSGGQLVNSHAYTLGSTGTRVAVQEHNSRFVNWTYDDLYRLVGEDIVDPVNGTDYATFTYDPVGNRLARTDGSGSTAYKYDMNDRLVDVGGVGRTYDSEGNTLTAGSTIYTWSPEDQLVAANTGAQELAFEYNVDGIRVSKDVDGVETDYVLDFSLPLAQVIEERSAGGLLASYVYGQALLSQARAGADTFYHADGVNSTRALTDEFQSVSDSYAYDSFGMLYGSSGTTVNLYRFAGEQTDAETGLEYMRARYLDASTGSFLSADPVLGNPVQPQSLLAYPYARNDPVNLRDESGRTVTSIAEAVIPVVTPLSIKHNSLRYGGKVFESRSAFAPQEEEFVRRSITTAETILIQIINEDLVFAVAFAPFTNASAVADRQMVNNNYKKMLRRSESLGVTYEKDESDTCEPSEGAFTLARQRILLCKPFFDGSFVEFNSPPLVIIHELAHAVGLDDQVEPGFCGGPGNTCYGERNALSLRKHVPYLALRNVPNYQLGAYRTTKW